MDAGRTRSPALSSHLGCPAELDATGLESVRESYASATLRARRIGFDLVEVHVAHGYLLHALLSPLTNRRTDRDGGSLSARMRFPLDVFETVRSAFPEDQPVTFRLSATDWMEGGCDIRQSVAFARELKALVCDLVDDIFPGKRNHSGDEQPEHPFPFIAL